MRQEDLSHPRTSEGGPRVSVEPERFVYLRVEDYETEEAISEYHLRIYSVGVSAGDLFHETTVDTSQAIRLPLPAGSLEFWVLEIHASGYAAYQESLEDCVEEHDEEPSVVSISKGAFFMGRILDSGGHPVPGAEVDADFSDSAWTDPEGRFCMTLPDPSDGITKILLTAERTDVGAVEFEMRILDYPQRRLPDLVLKGSAVLRGRLLLEDGTPLRGFTVAAQYVARNEDAPVPPGITWADAATDAHGGFVMKGMAPGRYEVIVDLADIEGRSLKKSSSMTLHRELDVRSAQVWRFQRLDIQVRYPRGIQRCRVQARLRFPGEKTVDLLSWTVGSDGEVRSLPLPVGVSVEVTASLPGGPWSDDRIAVKPGAKRQRLLVVVPEPESWVSTTLTLDAPRWISHKRARIEVFSKSEGWRWMNTNENPPGVFHFRIPVGRQKLRMKLVNRSQPRGCPSSPMIREKQPERIPYHAWMAETRTLWAPGGGSLRIRWQPRPLASVSIVFTKAASLHAFPDLRDAEICRLDPRDPDHERVLARDQVRRIRWGKAESFGSELPAGRHLFRFRVKGYEPVLRALWLTALEDRMVRIPLRPARPVPVPVPGSTEPYRCGRVAR